jgi:polar amino acid transport system ATP-binding protein
MSVGTNVRARGVYKSFGDTAILKGVNLDVPAQNVMCLIGPSGSGKSTLLRCINHLVKVDRGRIYIGDELMGYRRRNGKLHELADREVSRQRQHVGMVFQSFNLFPHLTTLGNLIEAPVRVKHESKGVAIERARRLLDRVGLSSLADAYPKQLSGGQQQRVAIARALAMEPKVMLFDEPTSALDPELVGEVLDVMRDLAASGMTMIVVTHEIGFAREVGDSVAFLADGVVLEVGPPSQVLSNPAHDRTTSFLSKAYGI